MKKYVEISFVLRISFTIWCRKSNVNLQIHKRTLCSIYAFITEQERKIRCKANIMKRFPTYSEYCKLQIS